MNVNSRNHNLDTRFEPDFSKTKYPPGFYNPVGITSYPNRPENHSHFSDRKTARVLT